MPVKVAVIDDYQNLASAMNEWSELHNSEVTFFNQSFHNEKEKALKLFPYDVIVTIRERSPFPSPLINQLTNLKLIAGTGRRQNHVDLEAAKARGDVVTGTHIGEGEASRNTDSGNSTAELTWGLILDLARKITWENNALHKGVWQSSISENLAGKTLGIMGLGRIGSKIANFGNAFGMDVISWGPTLTKNRAARSKAKLVSWDELFENSDFLSIHVLLSSLSKSWVGAREFSLMKPSAYIINTARSGIVDSEALVDALETRRIAGGAFDVFDNEPIDSHHPLLMLDNVIATPHLGYASRETLQEFLKQAIESIKSWLAGKPVNVVN